MDDRIKQNKEFNEAKQWLKDNGCIDINGIISKTLEEYKLIYTPNEGKTIEIKGFDSMELIIGLYRELKN